MCELSRFFTWALMVKVDSQVCVRVNSQGVRVTSQGVPVISQPVRVISKHCTSCRLCGVPPHPIQTVKKDLSDLGFEIM